CLPLQSHRDSARTVQLRTVGKIRSDDEIGVAFAVVVLERGGVRVPLLAWCYELASLEIGRGHSGSAPEKRDGRAPPEIDDDVEPTVFIEVDGRRSHRGRRRDANQSGRAEDVERGEACARAGNGSNDNLIGADVDVDDIVRVAVAVEIVQCDRGAD